MKTLLRFHISDLIVFLIAINVLLYFNFKCGSTISDSKALLGIGWPEPFIIYGIYEHGEGAFELKNFILDTFIAIISLINIIFILKASRKWELFLRLAGAGLALCFFSLLVSISNDKEYTTFTFGYPLQVIKIIYASADIYVKNNLVWKKGTLLALYWNYWGLILYQLIFVGYSVFIFTGVGRKNSVERKNSSKSGLGK